MVSSSLSRIVMMVPWEYFRDHVKVSSRFFWGFFLFSSGMGPFFVRDSIFCLDSFGHAFGLGS